MCALSEMIESYSSSGKYPVLLLDEYECFFEKSEGTEHAEFTNDFFETLRSCANQHSLVMVTASSRTLKDLMEGLLTSPLWNIFTMTKLSEFTDDEAALFIRHFWQGELTPTNEEMQLLKSYCGKHPLRMQVASYWILRNRKLRYNGLKLADKINKEFDSYFRRKIEKLKEWLKTILKTFGLGSFIAYILKNQGIIDGILKFIKRLFPSLGNERK